jgi:uroporphyrinogen III methyltransferase/synthase
MNTSRKETTGHVYLVGAGPGDPDLLTLRGKDLLSEADVVLYDALIDNDILRYADENAEKIYVGKRAGSHRKEQSEINRLLIEKARDGLQVVRLKGGDPFIFGRGGEEALALAGAGLPFDVIPGVTSGGAAPACAGIPLTHRHISSNVTFVTGHEVRDESHRVDWDLLARINGTLVIYMGVNNMGRICDRLIRKGMDPETPAAVISRGTLSDQVTACGTVADLPGRAQAHGIAPPAIIVVGEVVRLGDDLNWFERRPLFGQKAAVTRPEGQNAGICENLRRLGAEPIECPVISIKPSSLEQLRQVVLGVGEYDWIVFTSSNGVYAFFSALFRYLRDARDLANCKLAAIGPATGKRMLDYGVRPDIMPDEFTTSALSRALIDHGVDGKRILCPRSAIAPQAMADCFREAGAHVTEIDAYRVIPNRNGIRILQNRLEDGSMDWLVFTSSSTVRYALPEIDLDLIRKHSVKIASIGPATSRQVADFGLSVSVEAEVHTGEGLVDAIVESGENS